MLNMLPVYIFPLCKSGHENTLKCVFTYTREDLRFPIYTYFLSIEYLFLYFKN